MKNQFINLILVSPFLMGGSTAYSMEEISGGESSPSGVRPSELREFSVDGVPVPLGPIARAKAASIELYYEQQRTALEDQVVETVLAQSLGDIYDPEDEEAQVQKAIIESKREEQETQRRRDLDNARERLNLNYALRESLWEEQQALHTDILGLISRSRSSFPASISQDPTIDERTQSVLRGSELPPIPSSSLPIPPAIISPSVDAVPSVVRSSTGTVLLTAQVRKDDTK